MYSVIVGGSSAHSQFRTKRTIQHRPLPPKPSLPKKIIHINEEAQRLRSQHRINYTFQSRTTDSQVLIYTKMFMQHQPKQNENLVSPITSRIPMPASSTSSWHPISASPSQDMWELPASSSGALDDRDDFHTSGLHQEFSISSDTDDYSTNTIQERHSFSSLPPSITVRTSDSRNNHVRFSPSSISNRSSRGRTSGVALSGHRCVLGDATNTLRRKNNASNTRRIQRSYFN